MLFNGPVIGVRGLTKIYRLGGGTEAATSLGEALARKVRHPLKRELKREFRALDNISFEVDAGEVVGIIGGNGAGKSTLLKTLTRITAPTRGDITLRGRVGSLLEVGTGFHPELTGRENVYLNGTILGMRTKEIRGRFDEIVDFAKVERFLDTPVKRYSSGMYVRLAFAVAAHLETDILLVDEVLAVGDAEFQRKCVQAMGSAASSGRTVVFVSHQMELVKQLCPRSLVLESGKLVHDGATVEAITRVRQGLLARRAVAAVSDRRPSGTGTYRILSVAPTMDVFQGGEAVELDIAVERVAPEAGPFFFVLDVFDEGGQLLAHCDSRLAGLVIEDIGELWQGRWTLTSPWLRPGRYSVDLYAHYHGQIDGWDACTQFDVQGLPYEFVADEQATAHGPVLVDFAFTSI